MMAFQPTHGMHPMGPGGPMGPMPPQGHHMPGHPGAQMHPQMGHPQMPPHVSQPGMIQAMQMQGPHANAMSHPGHPNQPMFPNQMGQGFPQMSPQQQAMIQMQRQRMMQMQQLQQQQQQVNPQMMNPQALHAMQQQNMRVNLPTGMQPMQTPNNHEMQQRNAMMQQQQHQQRMMQNATMPPGSQGPPMVGPQSTPMRPQQSMQSLHDSTGGQTPQQQTQPVPGQTPGPGPQQTPQPQNQPRPPQAQQPPQSQSTPQPAQTPQQQPQPGPNQQAAQQQQQQQQQAQQQAQHQHQQAQQPQGSTQPQGQAQQTPQQQQAQAREQEHKGLIQTQQNNVNRFANMAGQRSMMQQTMQARAQQQQSNATPRLLLFCERLASIDSSTTEIGPWQDLVRGWFTEEAIFGMQLWDSEQDDRKLFEIPQATLARYFWIQHKTGVQRMQVSLSYCSQRMHSPQQVIVESPQMTVTYMFENGSKLICNGTLNAVLDNNTNKFDALHLYFEKHEETIPSTAILKKLQMESPLMSTKSPKLTKTPAKNKAQKAGRTVTLLESEIPRAPVQANGVTDGVARFLEMMETMSHMRALFDFSQQQPELEPQNALEQWVEQTKQVQAQGFQQPMPPGMRTPGQMGNGTANYFPSPGHMNLNLPNATSSPLMRAGASPGQPPNMQGQSGMTAPGPQPMVAQLSQQGSNSAGSNNASPNVATKKRRASQVKVEADDMKKNKVPTKRQKN